MKNIDRFLQGVAALLQLGSGGGWLKYTSGVFQLKNPSDTNYAKIAIAEATNSNEAVTLNQLQQLGAPIIMQGFAGSSPPIVVLNGILIICTATGGGYTESEIYVGQTGSWVLYTKRDGQPFTFAVDITIGATTYYDNYVYIWDVITSSFLSNGPTAVYDDTNVIKRKYVGIAYNSVGIQTISTPINAIIRCITFISDNDWTVGAGDLDNIVVRKLASSDIVTGANFEFSTDVISNVEVFEEMSSIVTIEVVTPSGITAGTGKIEIEYYVN